MRQMLNQMGCAVTMLICLCGLPQECLRGQRPEDFRIDLKHTKGMCREFSFPAWSLHEDALFSPNMRLEFFVHPNLNGDLLVRLRTAAVHYRTPKPEEYFLETYRINPKLPKLTALTDFCSWDKAQSLTYMDLPADMAEMGRRSKNDKQAEPDAFNWNGRRMPIRGREWTNQPLHRILVSPGKSYVALQSVTGKRYNASRWRSAGIYGGKFYIQIFNLESGREVSWVEGRWKNDWETSVFTGNTEWIQDDLLLLAFDHYMTQKVFLCKIEK